MRVYASPITVGFFIFTIALPAGAVAHEDEKLGAVAGATESGSQGFVPPVLMIAAQPSYTTAALKAGLEGTVNLTVIVGADGMVQDVRVAQGVGAGLDEAAVEAARELVFEAARFDGKPVACTVNYHFHFKLPGEDEEPNIEADVLPSFGPLPNPVAGEIARPGSSQAPAGVVEKKVHTPNYEVTVRARREVTAASTMSIPSRDFLLRARARPAEILAAAPGLHVVQHAGGGKANQYYLRGFDADHGTDIAFSIDGVPVNMVSHGHGQGYTDFNFLIPEIVERLEVQKGPYHAEHGDFATGGAIDVVTRRNVEQSAFSLTGGSFETLRSLLVTSPELAGTQTLFAAEVYTTNGPFKNAEDLQRYSAFAKGTRALSSTSELTLTAMSYAAGWNASGQLPDREVRAGRLDRFDSIDPTEGGASQRHGLRAEYEWRGKSGDHAEVMSYVTHNRFRLYSNFTFFSADPENGDMIEQGDIRTIAGAKAAYTFFNDAGGITFQTTLGAQGRSDFIDNALYNDRARERLATVVDANVTEVSAGAYASEKIAWTPWLRTIVGLRADWFGFMTNDHLAENAGTARAGAALVSPKATVILAPIDDTELYFNLGWGFHSNDARGVVRAEDAVTPMSRALGYEIGVRTQLFDRLELAACAFGLDLDGEIVWVGDAGTTEARGPTRRIGFETEARLHIMDWLVADADITWSDGHFTEAPEDANAVPLAPRLSAAGGLTAQHPDGWYGRVGAVHLGDRPATEDRFITARGFTRFDATAGYRTEDFELTVSVQNLFDRQYNEAQFANVSRLSSERSAASCPDGTRAVSEGGAFLGCEDLHFSPGTPINAQATATLFF